MVATVHYSTVLGSFALVAFYHMAQIFDERTIDEMDEFLVICQIFPTTCFY